MRRAPFPSASSDYGRSSGTAAPPRHGTTLSAGRQWCVQCRDQGLYDGVPLCAKLRFMPYFLEYVTSHTVSRAAINGSTLHEALVHAQKALMGLPCIIAVLRHASADSRVFGEGAALAGFTAAQGWRIQGRSRPQLMPDQEGPGD